MLFPQEHAQLVKAWIVKRLENISDADADVLADYVIALLDHEGDVATVRKLCEAEIPDFLKEDSDEFIDDVFRAIQYQAYLPGAPPLPPRQQLTQPQAPPSGMVAAFGLQYDDAPAAQAPPYPAQTYPGGSRKRTYQERDDVDMRGSQNFGELRFGGGRHFKQARRHGPRGRRDWDSPNNAMGFGQLAVTYDSGFAGGGAQWQPSPGVAPQFDMNRAMEMFGGMSLPGSGTPMGRGAHRMQQPFPIPPPGHMGEGKYDPNNAALAINSFMPNPSHGHGQQPYKREMRGGMRQHKVSPRKSHKAEVSADGPVFDRKRSTLVIENIPPENLNDEAVRKFFSQFGKVVQISLEPIKRIAIVKFDTWKAANAAFISPKVVFENRFVKVFWYKGDESALSASMSGNSVKGASNGSHRNGNGSSLASHEQESVSVQEPEIDLDEFIRKQEEIQKAQEEKRQKMQELERQKEEIQKKQKELLLKRQEEIARLNAKIALSMKKSREDSVIASEDGAGTATPSKASTQTEMLRAQLAALEKEAIEMGIDPDADIDSESQFSPSQWSSGGRGRGRGRGGAGYFRARGRAPRGGFRGGYVAGSNDATYAVYRLDNRPKKVAVIGVDFTVPERDESLRAYLFGIGEFIDIHTTSSQTAISFKDRKTAEKFMSSISDRAIPGIEGQVDLAWVAPDGSLIKPTPSTPRSVGSTGQLDAAQKKQPAARTKTDTEADGGLVAPGSGDDKEVSIVLDRPVDAAENGAHAEQGEQGYQGYMDYDVADDNQWDIG